MKKTALTILIVGILYLALGGFSLASKQEGLAGYEGEVWNQVDRANQILGRLEGQLDYGVDALKDINDGIVTARNNILAAQEVGDLDAAFSAVQDAQLSFNLMVEAYPDYFDLSEVFIGLQDETAGSFNRITYARQNLIDAQVSFNKTRIAFFPLMLFFDHVDVLGSGFDATTQVSPSTLGQ